MINTAKELTVNISKLDRLLVAVDDYATQTTHAQKHLKGRWNTVVRTYSDITGLDKKTADDHLSSWVITG